MASEGTRDALEAGFEVEEMPPDGCGLPGRFEEFKDVGEEKRA
jgi:hypothetical protein